MGLRLAYSRWHFGPFLPTEHRFSVPRWHFRSFLPTEAHVIPTWCGILLLNSTDFNYITEIADLGGDLVQFKVARNGNFHGDLVGALAVVLCNVEHAH